MNGVFQAQQDMDLTQINIVSKQIDKQMVGVGHPEIKTEVNDKNWHEKALKRCWAAEECAITIFGKLWLAFWNLP